MVDIPIGTQHEIPKGWAFTYLLDLVKINPNYRLIDGDEYSFVPMEAVAPNFGGITKPLRKVFERQGGTKFKNDDTLFAKITPCIENGKIALVDEIDGGIGFGSTEFLVFSPIKSKINPKYLYRLLTTHKVHSLAISRMEGSTGRQRVPKDAVKGLAIPLPPLPEQHKITEVLSTVDEAIEKTDAIIKETQELKKGLTQKLFTEGIGHTQFKETKIGRMPESWELKQFKALIDSGIITQIQDGNHGNVHPKSSDFVEEGIPFIMANNLVNGEVDTKNCHFITKKQADSLRIGFSITGDVLLSHKGTMGRVAIVPEVDNYLMLTPQVTLYRVGNRGKLSNTYLRYYFESKHFQDNISRLSEQSTRKYLGITEQKKQYIILPPLSEQNEIADMLSGVDAKIKNDQATKSELKQLKNGLCQVLLTGKVRVKV